MANIFGDTGNEYQRTQGGKNRKVYWINLATRLAARDGLRCGRCGGPLSILGDCQIDHKVPRSVGGTDEMSNLQLAHERCNKVANGRVVADKRICERCGGPKRTLRGRLCVACRQRKPNRTKLVTPSSLLLDRIVELATTMPRSSAMHDICATALADNLPELHAECPAVECSCTCHQQGGTNE
jgi:HNH endonuclease